MANLTYTEYFEDREEAMGAALAAKADGMKAMVTGPVKKIRRPKIGGGLEVVPNPGNKNWYVMVASDAEMIIV